MGWSYFGSDNDLWETLVFSILAGINALFFWPAARFCIAQPITVATWSMPLLCIMVFFLNIMLALGNKIGHNNALTHIGTLVFTIVMPLFLVAVFEMAYRVHKTRSVKFCGIEFDQGHRINTEPCSWFLRNAVRICALGLFLLGLIVDFQLFGLHDSTSGTSGFIDAGGASSQFILSLIPAVVMAAISIYLSIYMWRYGNNASMVVHSTICNRWVVLLLGSISMLAGQIPPEPAFRFTSSLGLTILLGSMVVVYKEVEREDQVQADFAAFLQLENTLSAIQSNCTKSPDDIQLASVTTAPVTRTRNTEQTALFGSRSWSKSGPFASIVNRNRFSKSQTPEEFIKAKRSAPSNSPPPPPPPRVVVPEDLSVL